MNKNFEKAYNKAMIQWQSEWETMMDCFEKNHIWPIITEALLKEIHDEKI
jgi:hypothetical protein